MSENNIPCVRWAEAEVLPYKGARRLNLGHVTTYFDGKGGIKHILALNPERVRILEDAIHEYYAHIHEYYAHEKDQDGPVVSRLVEDELGHVVGTAEIESEGVNMVARITLDPDMAPRPNTILVEFSFLTGPEAYQDEPEVVETNEMQLPIFEDDSLVTVKKPKRSFWDWE